MTKHGTRGAKYSKRNIRIPWPKVEHEEKKKREPKDFGKRYFKPKFNYKQSGKPLPGEKRGFYIWVPGEGWVKETTFKKWRKK
jgi:hypothetical protein